MINSISFASANQS
jgi:hypothetical protein